VRAAGAELEAAGAHHVIDSVADLWPVLETIGARIAAGERPQIA
jgi:phosphonoacetaldehyde hydrolase